MKQNLLRAVFFASILLTATACNDDDDDNGNSGPTPVNYTFKADLAFPFEQNTPDEVWSSTNVTATQRLDGSFQMIALSDGDSLVITTPSREVNIEYELDSASAAFLFSDLADENYYVRADGKKYGIVTSESSSSVFYTSDDTANNTISGIFNIGLEELIPTGPGGVNELVTFLEGDITDLPYTVETFEIPSGDGNVSFSAAGQAFNFDNAITVLNGDFIEIAAIDASLAPGFNMRMNADITPGTYTIGDETSTINASVTLNDFFDIYASNGGELVVTSHNMSTGNIVGTFTFGAVNIFSSNSVNVTNGAFNVNY